MSSIIKEIKLYTASDFHSLGMTSLYLPQQNVRWNINDLLYPSSFQVAAEDAYYLIVLTGLSQENLLRSVQWLQLVSSFLTYPTFVVIDDIPSHITEQLKGCNVVPFDKSHSISSLQRALSTWLAHEQWIDEYCPHDDYLAMAEWSIMIRYLQVKNMPQAALLSHYDLKKAYKIRQRAIAKLGFTHINDFLRAYPYF